MRDNKVLRDTSEPLPTATAGGGRKGREGKGREGKGREGKKRGRERRREGGRKGGTEGRVKEGWPNVIE